MESTYLYSVDRPRKAKLHFIGGSLSVRGWFLDQNCQGAHSIIVKINNKEVQCRKNLRYDVLKVFESNDIDPNCGFHIHFKVKRGLWKVSVIAKTNDNKEKVLTTFVCVCYYRDEKKAILNINGDYPLWSRLYNSLSKSDLKKMHKHMGLFRNKKPLEMLLDIQGLTPNKLKLIVSRILDQNYTDWILNIFYSSDVELGYLEEFLKNNPFKSKIKKHLLLCNNSKLSLLSKLSKESASEYFIFIGDQSLLRKHCLYMIAHEIEKNPEINIVYSDDDIMNEEGICSEPFFKPDWNPSLFQSLNYMDSFVAVKKSLLANCKHFKDLKEPFNLWELLLYITDDIDPKTVKHIPFVLCHKSLTEKKQDDFEIKKEVLKNFYKKKNINVDVSDNEGYPRVHFVDEPYYPMISIVMPSACNLKFLKPCIESIFKNANYLKFELIIVINEIRYDVPEQKAFLKSLKSNKKIRILEYPDMPFNFSQVFNWGVAQAKGEFILCLNDDMEIITENWLKEMAKEIIYGGASAVGVKLYYPNDTIQHGGVVLGAGGIADHLFKNLPRNADGPHHRAKLKQDLSCVTGACMLMKKDLFYEVDGCDESLVIAYNDVDLCMKMRQNGYRIVWTPFVELYHHESVSVGSHKSKERIKEHPRSKAIMRSKWTSTFKRDPFYNPNMSLKGGMTFEYAFPPRVEKPWLTA